jgi:preprotein translocase subunit SecG
MDVLSSSIAVFFFIFLYLNFISNKSQ